jgi:hypothetical protein
LHDIFKDVAIGYSFEFKMTDKNDTSAGLDFSMPFSKGSLTLGTSLSDVRSRTNTRQFDLAEEVGHLIADSGVCTVLSANWRYPLTGEIGLAETVKTYLKLASIEGFFSDDGKQSGGQGKPEKSKAKEFSDELDFTTEIGGTLAPVLSLSPVPNQFRLVKVSPKVSGSRKDVHKLTINFVKGDDGDRTTVSAGDIYPENFDPPKTGTVECVKGRCVDGTGVVLNFRPQTPDFKGTIQCDKKACTLESDVALGKSPTTRALEALERRRNQEAIRNVIREELGQ